VVDLHGERSAAVGSGAQFSGVAEHIGERDLVADRGMPFQKPDGIRNT
jgi:hypothetical protein